MSSGKCEHCGAPIAHGENMVLVFSALDDMIKISEKGLKVNYTDEYTERFFLFRDAYHRLCAAYRKFTK